MQVISLFSGMGGFELAAEWMGWENIVSCEINPFGQKILKHYWPNSYHHDDIKTINYEEIKKRINQKESTIVVGGFPCQPYSTAGKRLGKNDDRHLWPYCIETVRQLSPSFCLFENVRGLINWNGGMVFDEVQADLEAEGYEVLPFLLPACAVDAPHRRDRIWFVAHSNSNTNRNIGEQNRKENSLPQLNRQELYTRESSGATSGASTHTKGEGIGRIIRDMENKDGKQQAQEEPGQGKPTAGDISRIGNVANTKSLREHRAQELENSQGQGGERGGCNPDNLSEVPGENRGNDAANSSSKGLQRREDKRTVRSSREDREEQPYGFFPPTWEGFPTQSPLCSGNDGLRSRVDLTSISFPKWRNESIKAAGNAVVPQVVYEIFKAIEAYEKLKQVI